MVDKVKVFYREAGQPSSPVVLLLHGFPASSFQYRDLMPILAQKYRVIAPDLPGFGFTEAPEDFKYTFDNLSNTVAAFLDTLNIKRFAVYIFDYGAPTAFRLALKRPDAITAIVTQNGNAYEEGLGEFWEVVKKYWKSGSEEDGKALAPTFDFFKWQYVHGAPDPDSVPPETYNLDWALVQRPGQGEIQLGLFYDYRTNVELYPKFQEWMRNSQVPLLAVWGKNDPFFIPPGAEAYKRDLPNAIVKFVDGPHFALETHLEDISHEMLDFLAGVKF
ncbi:alpha/beta hydrolase fold protein [Rhizodiscina lignyota]|uniref:Alpha/beta hydrolase fold protein n=1 Tax=Rhizodiscina lignyota TaxID=1504668 RepID=A0A9P4I397_9PEZI|nr:alpha/beta hydrolase fold protein [Rhizodiscina lignyota]